MSYDHSIDKRGLNTIEHQSAGTVLSGIDQIIFAAGLQQNRGGIGIYRRIAMTGTQNRYFHKFSPDIQPY